jgi:hypothetical protein
MELQDVVALHSGGGPAGNGISSWNRDAVTFGLSSSTRLFAVHAAMQAMPATQDMTTTARAPTARFDLMALSSCIERSHAGLGFVAAPTCPPAHVIRG